MKEQVGLSPLQLENMKLPAEIGTSQGGCQDEVRVARRLVNASLQPGSVRDR